VWAQSTDIVEIDEPLFPGTTQHGNRKPLKITRKVRVHNCPPKSLVGHYVYDLLISNGIKLNLHRDKPNVNYSVTAEITARCVTPSGVWAWAPRKRVRRRGADGARAAERPRLTGGRLRPRSAAWCLGRAPGAPPALQAAPACSMSSDRYLLDARGVETMKRCSSPGMRFKASFHSETKTQRPRNNHYMIVPVTLSHHHTQ